jgi:hypothetical protein
MTNEMRTNVVKARFEERTNTKNMKDSPKLATQGDLYRLADETSTVICMLADAMDRGLADMEDDGLDWPAFGLGMALGALLMLGICIVFTLI